MLPSDVQVSVMFFLYTSRYWRMRHDDDDDDDDGGIIERSLGLNKDSNIPSGGPMKLHQPCGQMKGDDYKQCRSVSTLMDQLCTLAEIGQVDKKPASGSNSVVYKGEHGVVRVTILCAPDDKHVDTIVMRAEEVLAREKEGFMDTKGLLAVPLVDSKVNGVWLIDLKSATITKPQGIENGWTTEGMTLPPLTGKKTDHKTKTHQRQFGSHGTSRTETYGLTEKNVTELNTQLQSCGMIEADIDNAVGDVCHMLVTKMERVLDISVDTDEDAIEDAIVDLIHRTSDSGWMHLDCRRENVAQRDGRVLFIDIDDIVPTLQPCVHSDSNQVVERIPIRTLKLMSRTIMLCTYATGLLQGSNIVSIPIIRAIADIPRDFMLEFEKHAHPLRDMENGAYATVQRQVSFLQWWILCTDVNVQREFGMDFTQTQPSLFHPQKFSAHALSRIGKVSDPRSRSSLTSKMTRLQLNTPSEQVLSNPDLVAELMKKAGRKRSSKLLTALETTNVASFMCYRDWRRWSQDGCPSKPSVLESQCVQMLGGSSGSWCDPPFDSARGKVDSDDLIMRCMSSDICSGEIDKWCVFYWENKYNILTLSPRYRRPISMKFHDPVQAKQQLRKFLTSFVKSDSLSFKTVHNNSKHKAVIHYPPGVLRISDLKTKGKHIAIAVDGELHTR